VAATGESAAEEEDFTEDETDGETEQGLLSESVDHRNFRQHETITFSDESSSTESYFSVSEDEEEDLYEDELEHTPVRERSMQRIDFSLDSTGEKSLHSLCNSEPLRIDSIHLPPIKNSYTESPMRQKAAPDSLKEKSTVKVRETKTTTKGFSYTPVLLPAKNCIKARNKVLTQSVNNLSSDTDTSLSAHCCTDFSKLRW